MDRRVFTAVAVAAVVLLLIPVAGASPDAEFTYSPDEPWVDNEIEFNASETTPGEHNISIYEWRFGDGEIDNGETVTYAYDEAGSYDVNLLVIDTEGNTGEAESTLNVEEEMFPTAAFDHEPEEPRAGETVTFDASDADGDIQEYSWLVEGDTVEGDETVEHVFEDEGEHEVVLSVTNHQNNTDNVRETVTVEGAVGDVTPSAVINASADEVETGEEFEFRDETVLEEGEVVSRTWTVGDEEYTDVNVSHVFDEAGEYELTLEVTSDAGYSDTTETTVTVVEAEEEETDEGNDDTEPLPGFGFVAALTALLGLSAYRLR